jgi:hypothetical protein
MNALKGSVEEVIKCVSVLSQVIIVVVVKDIIDGHFVMISIVDMEFVKNWEITGFGVNAIMDIVVKIALREQIVSSY